MGFLYSMPTVLVRRKHSSHWEAMSLNLLHFKSSVGPTISYARINLYVAPVSYLSEWSKVGDGSTHPVLRSVSTEYIQKTLVLCMPIDSGACTTKLKFKFIQKQATQKTEYGLLVGQAIGSSESFDHLHCCFGSIATEKLVLRSTSNSLMSSFFGLQILSCFILSLVHSVHHRSFHVYIVQLKTYT